MGRSHGIGREVRGRPARDLRASRLPVPAPGESR
jgi:hypothetical protein